MFYSQIILARKGPLGKIWLAAHFDKKLTKSQIFSTDISSSVDAVLNPTAPLALRVSGHLMLGIVRIYSRKVKYLMSDCTEAMWKIKLAFRPGNVDIDPNFASAVNVDDIRYFGTASIDADFPELENTAFPQYLLAGYEVNTAPLKSQLFPMSADENFDASNLHMGVGASARSASASPAESATFSAERSRFSSGIGTFGRVSDVEITRAGGGASARHSIMSPSRASLSSLGRRVSGISAAMNVDDDDIPAFEEKFDDNQFGDAMASTFDGRPSFSEFVDFDAAAYDVEEKVGHDAASSLGRREGLDSVAGGTGDEVGLDHAQDETMPVPEETCEPHDVTGKKRRAKRVNRVVVSGLHCH
jgi:cohesin complex subunit SCC1